jgi:AcrR family transcriptional regulator
VPSVSGVTDVADALVDEWATGYRDADDLERRLVRAARACIARWGLRKTTLEDIAHEAGVSRATAYRAFPGGKDRLAEAVLCHEAGRQFATYDAALSAADSLEDLLVVGVSGALAIMADDVVRSVIRHDPGLVLPHFAFHRLDRVLDVATALCRPHLGRFLPVDAVRPAADLLARVVLSFGFRPAPWLDTRDPAAVRRLVTTYLVPALTPKEP